MTVILIHPPNTSESLLHAASHQVDFHQLVASVPLKPGNNNHTDASVFHGGPPATELLLTNLPSRFELDAAQTGRQVGEMAAIYGGLVLQMSDQAGSAVVQFTQVDQARRFKAQYLHFRIGERKLNIMNHNNNNSNSNNSAYNNRFNRGKSPYRYGTAPQVVQQQYLRRSRTRSESGGGGYRHSPPNSGGGGRWTATNHGEKSPSSYKQRSMSHDSLCDVVVMDNYVDPEDAGDGGCVGITVEDEDSAVVAAVKSPGSSVESCRRENSQLIPHLPVYPTNPLTAAEHSPRLNSPLELTESAMTSLQISVVDDASSKTEMSQQYQSQTMRTDCDRTSKQTAPQSSKETSQVRPASLSTLLAGQPKALASPQLALSNDKPVVILMFVLNCSRDPTLVGEKVTQLLGSRGLASCRVQAATVQRDVEVRISCPSHMVAGRLVDKMQAGLPYLTVGDVIVKRYAVRSEFLSSEDKLIYRVMRIMGWKESEDVRVMDFGRLQELYEKTFGEGRLELDDVRQVDVLNVVGSTEAAARVQLISERRRRGILR